MKTEGKFLTLGYPAANLAAKVPGSDLMLKVGADFIHTQAGWEITLLSIAKTALGLSKTRSRHTIGGKSAICKNVRGSRGTNRADSARGAAESL